MSFVGDVKSLRSSSDRADALLGLLRSTARSCVENRLVTSTTGAFSPSFQTTCRNSAPYLGSRLISAVLAFVFQVLPPGTNQSSLLKAGNGTHACTTPAGWLISRRVTASKVRQAPGLGANGLLAAAKRGHAIAAANTPPAFSTSRRLIAMLSPPSYWVGWFGRASCSSLNRASTSGRDQSRSPSTCMRTAPSGSSTNVVGNTLTPHAFAAARSASSATRKLTGFCSKYLRSRIGGSATLTARTATASPFRALR